VISALLIRLLMKPFVENSAKASHKHQNVLGRDHMYGVGTPKIKKGGTCGPNKVL